MNQGSPSWRRRKICGVFQAFSPRLLDEPKAEAAKRGLPLRVMLQDEARCGRITAPYACWAPPGVRPDGPSQIIREYTYLYGAVSPGDGTCDFLILPAMDGDCMQVFLAELRRRYAGEYLAVFWDGAPCHQPGAIIMPDNIWLEKLPPQCPDLNPKDTSWDDMRESFFANLLFDSMDAVEAQLIAAAHYISMKPTKNAFNPSYHGLGLYLCFDCKLAAIPPTSAAPTQPQYAKALRHAAAYHYASS